MKVTLTGQRNGIVWRLYKEKAPDKVLAEVSQLPVPSKGDKISVEDIGPLTITRVEWFVRADYPLEVDVWAK